MKITEQAINNLEKALGVKLYEEQIDNILFGVGMDHTQRQNGKTYAYCIRLALSKGEPLDIRNPKDFCDGHYENTLYPNHFMTMFMEIYTKLKDAGFDVRPITPATKVSSNG